LIAYGEVFSDDPADFDQVEFTWGDSQGELTRDGSGSVDGVVTETSAGFVVVAQLPDTDAGADTDEVGLAALAPSDTMEFDVRIVGGSTSAGWNTTDQTGTLTLVEALSYTPVLEAETTPVIDGEDRKSTRLNSSHVSISYAVFCL